MSLDFDTLHVVATLNATILMVVFAGVLWGYRSFAATKYWLASLALHGIGAILLTMGAVGDLEATASFGNWLFAIAYCVTWQGVRVFYQKLPAWRVAGAIAAFSAFVMVALAHQERSAQTTADAVLQIVLIVLIVLTVLRHQLRPAGFVVLGGAALALAGNIVEVASNLTRVADAANAERNFAVAGWLYLAVIVGAGVCYVGFLLMAFDRLRSQQQNFVALVSHEFRGPLGVVAAAADNLSLSPAADADEVALRAAKIQRTVKRMSMLIDNVFADHRLDAWQTPFAAKAKFDLNEVLHAIKAGWDSDTTARVTFEFGDTAPIKGDRDLIEIVLMNLIQNALKYSNAPSPVTVRLSRSEGAALVDVIDQGVGIAPDNWELIFMKYYRAAGRRVSGSGLGLYISRELARQHGGDIQLVFSNKHGSTFRLTLPTVKGGHN